MVKPEERSTSFANFNKVVVKSEDITDIVIDVSMKMLIWNTYRRVFCFKFYLCIFQFDDMMKEKYQFGFKFVFNVPILLF